MWFSIIMKGRYGLFVMKNTGGDIKKENDDCLFAFWNKYYKVRT